MKKHALVCEVINPGPEWTKVRFRMNSDVTVDVRTEALRYEPVECVLVRLEPDPTTWAHLPTEHPMVVAVRSCLILEE